MRWHIFCRVVDNLGDIGVCWRLARQLVAEYADSVELWVDDWEALALLLPGIRPGQHRRGVCLQHWHATAEFGPVADVVVEGFACGLPSTYLVAMSAHPPVWVNLEYLSAEDWVDSFHAQSSIHPATGLRQWFYFPGFGERTGGLLREQHLAVAQQQFERQSWWQTQGLPAPAADELAISLFCYPHAPLQAWLQVLQDDSQKSCVYLTPGHARTAWASITGVHLEAGQEWQQGGLRVVALPYLDQDVFDQLLWACDLNLVRGEDSLLRALWAAQPMLWHIYAQADEAHWPKLTAFAQTHLPHLATWHQALNAWNGRGDFAAIWPELRAWLPLWHTEFSGASQRLMRQTDLACRLRQFCLDRCTSVEQTRTGC